MAITGLVIGLIATVWEPAAVRAGGMPSVFVNDAHGLTVIEPDEKSRVIYEEQRALTNFDGGFTATVKTARAGKTTIEVRDTWTGSLVWSTEAAGTWRPEAVANDGNQVLLGDPSIGATALEVPSGRAATALLLVRKDLGAQKIDLDGNFVAEAFFANGQGAALVEFLPPLRPTAYRVRPLDFLGDSTALRSQLGNQKLVTRSADGIEKMQGVRLNHSWDRSGKALYTLYDASSYLHRPSVFVHALDLVSATAHCLDVPAEIDAGSGKGRVVWLQGGKLVVIGARGIARMDAATGAVEQVVRTRFAGVPVAFGRRDQVWIGVGRRLEERRTSDLTHVRTFTMKSGVSAGVAIDNIPPIVLDTRGRVWYVTDAPILRGSFGRPIAGGDPTFLVHDPFVAR